MVRYYARVYNKEGLHILTTPEESTEDSVLANIRRVYLEVVCLSSREREGFTYVMVEIVCNESAPKLIDWNN